MFTNFQQIIVQRRCLHQKNNLSNEICYVYKLLYTYICILFDVNYFFQKNLLNKTRILDKFIVTHDLATIWIQDKTKFKQRHLYCNIKWIFSVKSWGAHLCSIFGVIQVGAKIPHHNIACAQYTSNNHFLIHVHTDGYTMAEPIVDRIMGNSLCE